MERRHLIDRKHEVQAEYRRVRRELERPQPAGDDRSNRDALQRRLSQLGAEERRLRLQIDRTPESGNVESMSWFKKLMSIFRSEAADVKEGLGNVGKTLDEELAKKERELAASPEERIDMILEENAAADERFASLEDKIRGETAAADAEAEVEDANGENRDAE